MEKFVKVANALIFKTQKEFQTRNYLTAFEKMILTFIQHQKYSNFTKAQFKNDFTSFFSLNVTNLLISNFLNNLASKGYLKKRTADYLVLENKIKEENPAKNYEKISNEMSNFVQKFVDFYNEDNENQISLEKAELIICTYIELMVAQVSIKKEKKHIDLTNDMKTFELFLRKISQNNNDLYEIYKGVFLGRIFTSVMVENDIVSDNSIASFNGLNIYLDSDFVFNSLGLNYYSSSEEYISMINTLKTMGANILIFEHTYEEMKRIITSALNWIGNSDFDQTLASKTTSYFVLNRASKDEVNNWVFELESKICELGIIIDRLNTIDYNEKDLSGLYLENIFNKIVEEYGVTESDIKNRYDTYNSDAKSLYSIHKMRKGNIATSIKNAKYIFITHNYALCKVANDITHEKFNEKTVPLALNDRLINVLLWFGTPQYQDKNSLMFLIPCVHNAFEPSKEMIQKIYSVCEKMRDDDLMTESALFDWKTNPVLQQNIIEHTRNNPCKIDSTTPTYIIKQYQDELQKKYDNKSSKINSYVGNHLKKLDEEIAKYKKHEGFYIRTMPLLIYWFSGLIFVFFIFVIAMILFSKAGLQSHFDIENLLIALASLIIGYIPHTLLFLIKILKNQKSKINIVLSKLGKFFFKRKQKKIDSLIEQKNELLNIN